MRAVRLNKIALFFTTGTMALGGLSAVGTIAQESSAAPTNPAEPNVEQNEKQHNEQNEPDADAARIEKLAKYLTNSRWTGKFTLNHLDKPPTAEHYEITQAEKAENGDYWNLVARIKYADHDVTLPLPPIEIKWAGETPVITVDQVTIPSLGTFDARVLIRGGQYAGTWSHDQVGGHLFGTIDKIEEKK